MLLPCFDTFHASHCSQDRVQPAAWPARTRRSSPSIPAQLHAVRFHSSPTLQCHQSLCLPCHTLSSQASGILFPPPRTQPPLFTASCNDYFLVLAQAPLPTGSLLRPLSVLLCAPIVFITWLLMPLYTSLVFLSLSRLGIASVSFMSISRT